MSEEINRLVEELATRCEKIGLYLRQHSITIAGEYEEGSEEVQRILAFDDELKQKMLEEEVNVVIFGIFTANEVAFSDRVQSPDKFKDDTTFREIMPTAEELARDKLRERLSKGEVQDLLDLLDDDDDDVV